MNIPGVQYAYIAEEEPGKTRFVYPAASMVKFSNGPRASGICTEQDAPALLSVLKRLNRQMIKDAAEAVADEKQAVADYNALYLNTLGPVDMDDLDRVKQDLRNVKARVFTLVRITCDLV